MKSTLLLALVPAAASTGALELDGANSKVIFDNGEATQLDVNADYLRNLATKVAALQAGQTTSEGKVATLETGKAASDAKIANLEAGKAAADAKIASLEAGQVTADAKIATCEAKVAALEAARGSGSASCSEHLAAHPSAPSGTYHFSSGLFYCDMVHEGGGWTKIMSSEYPHFFNAGNYQSLNSHNPGNDNYSAIGQLDSFKKNGKFELRLQIARSGKAGTTAPEHMVAWKQTHNPFTATGDDTGFELVAGVGTTTCGGFNGLHNKYTSYSYTCDPDLTDGVGCWWMQVAPSQSWNGNEYLDGFKGGSTFHRWQVLWVR